MIKKIAFLLLIGLFFNNCTFAEDCSIVRKSIRFYENKVIKNENDVCSLYNLANEYLLRNKIQEGLDTYSNIIKINPKEEKAYIKRAIIYRDFKNYENEYREYGRLIKNIPDSVSGNADISYVYQNISDYENALKHINKAIELTNGQEKWYFYRRASILENMGKYREAIEDYTKFAESAHRYNFAGYLGINGCYEALGDAAKANEAYQKWREGGKNCKCDISLIRKIKMNCFDLKAKFYVDKLH